MFAISHLLLACHFSNSSNMLLSPKNTSVAFCTFWVFFPLIWSEFDPSGPPLNSLRCLCYSLDYHKISLYSQVGTLITVAPHHLSYSVFQPWHVWKGNVKVQISFCAVTRNPPQSDLHFVQPDLDSLCVLLQWVKIHSCGKYSHTTVHFSGSDIHYTAIFIFTYSPF